MKIEAPLVPVICTTADINTTPRSSADTVEDNGIEGLPPNVHLLSLDRVGLEYSEPKLAKRVLLRVRHIFQEGESPQLSTPVTFDLTDAVPNNVALTAVVRVPLNGIGVGIPLNSTMVTLRPLETLTFEVSLRRMN